MRQIGKVPDEESATKLVAFLLINSIDSVANQGDGCWEIWSRDEDDLAVAKSHLADFNESPDDEKYADALREATELAKAEMARKQKAQQNVIVMNDRWSKRATQRKPLVFTMIIITVAVFMTTSGWRYSTFGGSTTAPELTAAMKALLFVDPDNAKFAAVQYVNERLAEDATADEKLDQEKAERFADRAFAEAQNDLTIKLQDVRKGQLWRIFTPMFIHFGILHILFNMYWLNSLGGQFENIYGTTKFGLFVLSSAAVSGLIQDLMPYEWQGTAATSMGGGMSGVNYALAGLIWMKTLYAPSKGFVLNPATIFILILWMFVGIVSSDSLPIANWAHGGGFVFGLIVGYFPEFFKSASRSE